MQFNRHFTLSDYLAIGFISFCFILRCLMFGGDVMWTDEVLTYNLVHDDSTSHMLKALGDQADATPPLYYLLVRAWAFFFSDGTISLRMFSTCGFCAGFALLWSVMRPRFGFFLTLAVFALVLIPNKNVAFQSLNIRCYGLLFALGALTIWLGIKFVESERLSWKLLLANALTQAALILTHPLSGFSGAAVMGGVLLSDLVSRRKVRYWIPTSYISGWLALLLWWKQFLRQADVNNPSSWVPVPDLKAFFSEIRTETGIDLYFWLLLFAIALWVVTRLKSPVHPGRSKGSVRHRIIIIAACLVGLAPVFWIISRCWPTNSIFLSRYMITATIGWSVLFAVFMEYLFTRITFSSRLVVRVAMICLMCVGLKSLTTHVTAQSSEKSEKNSRIYFTGITDATFGHTDLPIICSSIHEFLPRRHYGPDPARYFFLLDWEAVTSPATRAGLNVSYKALSAQARYGYESNIVEAESFLSSHPAFLIQDVPGRSATNWCIGYLRERPYKMTALKANKPLPDRKGAWPLCLVELEQ